ncbi:MAG TPA: protein translocase subunit SecD [Candidatus Limnocylindrales bacterium]|nr:protein translocase subunit SecD [Candidatus Limnocylindrales bacterium]
MQRLLPFLMVALGLGALLVDVAPNLNRPGSDPPEPIETRLGLDLRGGLRGEYEAITANNVQPSSGDMETIRTIIENRVNATGVAEPIVQTQGTNRVVVEIPGVRDPEQVRKLIGATGKLEFVPLPPARFGTSTSSGSEPPPQYGDPMDPSLPPLFDGKEIDPSGVAPGFDQTTGESVVQFKLKSEGAKKFADYTRTHVGEYFAIVLDGIVQSAPTIREPITTGSGQISGQFSSVEMNRLVTTLKFGALPLQLREVGFENISATLGETFLRQSILAGAIGIGLVFLFMLLHYRLPGLVACLALVYYALVVYAIFRLVPVTLTLAGIAAFVLSVGMAVDANILIFERTKEELRAGKTVLAAIEAGFNRAWNSILDSNVSSLITATILFYFGSSTIRGFALVLIIGVLTSMFTAISLSRAMLRWVVRQPWARHAALYGVKEEEFVVFAPRGRSREAGVRV